MADTIKSAPNNILSFKFLNKHVTPDLEEYANGYFRQADEWVFVCFCCFKSTNQGLSPILSCPKWISPQ
jgi:hypothetical protein